MNIIGITPEKKNEFFQRLTERKLAAIESVKSIRESLSNIDESGADAADVAAKIEERTRLLSELNRVNQVFKQTSRTLNNFSEFGYCIDCGEDIELARLEANPTHVRCVHCQTMAEVKARQRA